MKIKGQHTVEVVFIGAVLLLTGLISLFLFSGNIKSVFDKSNPSSFFANRNIKQVNTQQYLSNVNLKVDGQSLQSPVETVIKSEMLNNSVQTAGSSGNLNETVAVAQQYINQLTSILQSQPQSASRDALIASLNSYNTATNNFISTNGDTATTPLEQTLNNIQLAINLNNQGTLATSLNSNTQAYLSSLPDNESKNLLSTYVNDLMNLGASLNYTVDSRDGLNTSTTSTSKITSTSSASTSVYAPTSANLAAATQVNNMYNTLQQAFTNITSTSNGSLKGACPSNNQSTADNCYMNLFASYLSTTKTCLDTYAISQGCWGTTYDLNGSVDQSVWNTATFDLSDGSAIQFAQESSNCTSSVGNVKNICAVFTIDINGASAPNTMGKDEFNYWITSTGVLPVGSPADGYASDCIPGSTASSNLGWGCAQQMINLAQSQTSTASPSSKLAILESLEQQLTAINNNTSISTEQKAQIAGTIQIYRQGDFSQILPDSYNTAVLCNTIGASVVNKTCNVT